MDELRAFAGILLPYQKQWLLDESRFRIANKSRQTGFTLFCGTLDATIRALRGQPNYYLSAGERQAKEAIQDVIKHAQAFKLSLEAIESIQRIDDRDWKVLEVKFPGGGKVVGLPANPSTVRGCRGNMYFDEYAFHQDSRAIWRAAFPIAAHGWKVSVFSTPNGKGNDFYDKWVHGGDIWSRHQIDIYEAVAQGLPLNIDELRAGCANDDDWQQEFCCAFLDTAINWISNELLDAADDAGAWVLPPEGWRPTGPTYLGVDVGRTRDLTVLWLAEELDALRWTRAVVGLQNVKFRQQRTRIDELMQLGVRGAAIDQTGLGMQLAEELAEDYGEDRVAQVTFTAANKAEMAKSLRKAMEDRRWRIPVDLEIRRDFRKVKRVITAAGNETFQADRSEQHGHADHFWACALAERALLAGGYVLPTVDVIERGRASQLYDHVGRFGEAEAAQDEDDRFDSGAWLEDAR